MINNFFDGFHYDWKKALHVGDAKTKNLAVFFGKLKGIYRPEPSSNGTVSVCPAKTKPPGPVPSVAMRFNFVFSESQAMTSQLNPISSKVLAGNQLLACYSYPDFCLLNSHWVN
ncbi:MAG: hypothetical protein Ct9H300mP22_2650 [Gammaproteobacteria bacterium]|nr:MAG: hypothetical protein Ct9H300mP22_2650 [Gammaproteobacteria bacterium]